MTMSKARLEAFSDGVLAIIITIMVLEMKVPHGTGLLALQPLISVFLSYILSFVYIGIYWNNHHHLMHAARHVNGSILWANLHLLFWLIDTICHRLDGREPFCAMAGGAVRSGIAVRGNRLFSSHENTHRPA